MRRRPLPSARFVTYTLLVMALLSLFPLYSWYKQVAAPIPPGVRLGGVDVGAPARERAARGAARRRHGWRDR